MGVSTQKTNKNNNNHNNKPMSFSVFGNGTSQKVPNKYDKSKMFQHKRMYQKVIRKLSMRSNQFHTLNKIIAKHKLYKHHVIKALNELLEHWGIHLYIGYEAITSHGYYSVSFHNDVPLVLYTDSNMVVYVYGLDEDGEDDICRVLLHTDVNIDMAVVDAEENNKYKRKMGKERNVLMYYSANHGGNVFYDTYQCVYPITPTRLEEEMKWVVKGIPRQAVVDYAMCMEDTKIYNMFVNGRNTGDDRNEELEGEILVLDNNIIQLQMEIEELKKQTNNTNENLDVLSYFVKSGEEELERWKWKCVHLEKEVEKEKQQLEDYKSEHSVILHSLLDENKKWMERYADLKNTFKLFEIRNMEEKCLMKLEWKQKMEDWKTNQMTVVSQMDTTKAVTSDIGMLAVPPENTKEEKVVAEEKQKEYEQHQPEQMEEEKNIVLWNYLYYGVYYWLVVIGLLAMVSTVNTFVNVK